MQNRWVVFSVNKIQFFSKGTQRMVRKSFTIIQLSHFRLSTSPESRLVEKTLPFSQNREVHDVQVKPECLFKIIWLYIHMYLFVLLVSEILRWPFDRKHPKEFRVSMTKSQNTLNITWNLKSAYYWQHWDPNNMKPSSVPGFTTIYVSNTQNGSRNVSQGLKRLKTR